MFNSLNNIFVQVPAFETSDGKYLYESNAIAYYGKKKASFGILNTQLEWKCTIISGLISADCVNVTIKILKKCIELKMCERLRLN